MACCVREVEGDLFSAPKEYSLAHCVSADLKMGAGLGVQFKQLYGSLDELKAQNVGVGQVGVLAAGGHQRFIYYLLTKKMYNQKPTYGDLIRSLQSMKQHMVKNRVSKVAMPRIGCGSDRLDWGRVKGILNSVFGQGGPYDIIVYNCVSN